MISRQSTGSINGFNKIKFTIIEFLLHTTNYSSKSLIIRVGFPGFYVLLCSYLSCSEQPSVPGNSYLSCSEQPPVPGNSYLSCSEQPPVPGNSYLSCSEQPPVIPGNTNSADVIPYVPHPFQALGTVSHVILPNYSVTLVTCILRGS